MSAMEEAAKRAREEEANALEAQAERRRKAVEEWRRKKVRFGMQSGAMLLQTAHASGFG